MEKNSILLEARWEIKFPINQLTFMPYILDKKARITIP